MSHGRGAAVCALPFARVVSNSRQWRADAWLRRPFSFERDLCQKYQCMTSHDSSPELRYLMNTHNSSFSLTYKLDELGIRRQNLDIFRQYPPLYAPNKRSRDAPLTAAVSHALNPHLPKTCQIMDVLVTPLLLHTLCRVTRQLISNDRAAPSRERNHPFQDLTLLLRRPQMQEQTHDDDVTAPF